MACMYTIFRGKASMLPDPWQLSGDHPGVKESPGRDCHPLGGDHIPERQDVLSQVLGKSAVH